MISFNVFEILRRPSTLTITAADPISVKIVFMYALFDSPQFAMAIVRSAPIAITLVFLFSW